jgi:HK97 family phage major capsid protein
MSRLKVLQDRAAAISSKMDELVALAERSEDQTAELRKLSDEATQVEKDLAFEQDLVKRAASLNKVVEPSKPAGPAADQPPPKVEIRAISHVDHRSLRAFNTSKDDVTTAYRCGRWLVAEVFGRPDDIRWCKENGLEVRALAGGVNSAGGALVPDEFSARVIRLVETYGTFPGAAENVTMGRDTLVVPKRLTGTTAYFVGEGQTITESEPTWTNVMLVAKKLAVSCRMSSEVTEDAVVSIADAVAAEFATSLAYKIDECGWNGNADTGGTYGGIHGIVPKIDSGSHTASVVTAASGNTAFSNLDYEDFLAVVGKLPLYARQGAAWYISPVGKSLAIDRLKLAQGGSDASDMGAGVDGMFLGYPVKLVHVMNSTVEADASKVKVLFGNLALSSIYAKRRDFSVRMFDQVYATTDQLLLQGSMRFDINHHSLGDTSTPGPVIALKTPGS